ncbi:hypothetical protein Prudu_012780 [Prunus dulcis]|uniref:Uncharacterized protein n=1 Tax=Prunus dulcis TaxID=3755 RepID=A0A4Y1RDP4_PRUDU|nr:hypothetical protein Prudu_012780 [Prunus dulcis]
MDSSSSTPLCGLQSHSLRGLPPLCNIWLKFKLISSWSSKSSSSTPLRGLQSHPLRGLPRVRVEEIEPTAEFTLGEIDLDQPTAVLSQLNVWLNDKGKAVEQGVQLRKRKRIIPMWKIIEGSELVQKTLPETTGLQMLDPIKAIPHDDLVKLLKPCWEWRHNPNLVMQFGNVEAEIEFFASLVNADGWLKGDIM